MARQLRRLAQLLSSASEIPNYSKKWSAFGRMLKRDGMIDQMASVTPKTTVLDVGQPNKKLTAITGIKLQLADGEEVDVERDLVESFTQYSSERGLPELQGLLLDLQRREHNPPQLMADKEPSQFDLCITTGTTEALQICVKAFMEEGDSILMEEISYINFIMTLKKQGMNVQGVASDEKGMIPAALEDTLTNWEVRFPGRKMPKLLYSVSAASNPIGCNWCRNRMVEIYLICRRYDILIMDDGAYHYIQHAEQQRPRSFQSFDIDGRVIRFDSFSKIIGAGYRVGWLSGPTAIIEKVVLNSELSSIHPSIPAQVALYTILKKWGSSGFEARVKMVSDFYRSQAVFVLNACHEYLSDLATWIVPHGGMFIWISFHESVSGDSEEITQELKDEYDIQVFSGKFFHADSNENDKSIRLCYSTASEEVITHAIKCLADVLRRRTPQAAAIANGLIR